MTSNLADKSAASILEPAARCCRTCIGQSKRKHQSGKLSPKVKNEDLLAITLSLRPDIVAKFTVAQARELVQVYTCVQTVLDERASESASGSSLLSRIGPMYYWPRDTKSETILLARTTFP